jgi:metalloendopeptidase OMA1, mitochondrial
MNYRNSQGRVRKRFKLLPLVIAAIVIAFQYFSSERVTNPITGETAHVSMSMDQEAALGLQSYRKILSESRTINSGPEFDMVVRVAERLAPVTGKAGADFEWSVSLIDSPQANAFCLPGGKIAVYTGILPIVQDEEGLAAVMGHEMAHAIARHGSQRIFRQQAMQTAMMGVQGSISDMSIEQQRMLIGLLGAGAQYGMILPFSREHESEADYMGTLYMARAGYDPRAAIALWQRMEDASSGQPPEFASTHPSHETRIQQLQAWMPEMMEVYGKSRQ